MTESQKEAVEAALAMHSRESVPSFDLHLMYKIGLEQLAKRGGHETVLLRELVTGSVLKFWDENPEQADAAIHFFKALRSAPSKKLGEVSYAQIKEIRSNPRVAENLGLYIAKLDQYAWVGLRNLKGEANFGEFTSEEHALRWLTNF